MLFWGALAAHAASQEEIYQAARQAEDAGDLGALHRLATDCVEVAPEGQRAQWCMGRQQWVMLRQDTDGGFTGWTHLEQARTGGDPAVVDGIITSPTTAPVVQAEALLWRSTQPHADSLEDLALAWDQEHTLDALTQQRVGLSYARALAQHGQITEARAIERRFEVATTAPRPTPVQTVRLQRRRQQGAWASGIIATLFLVTTIPLALRSWRPPPRFLGLIPLALLMAGTWGIAHLWSPGAGAAIPLSAGGIVVSHLLTAASLRTLHGRYQRGVVRTLSVLATLGICYLAAWFTDTLDWVGL